MKQTIGFFLRGMLMGISDVIPGVSGGTMALITGIYPRLIKAISDSTRVLSKNFFKELKKLDYALLIPLATGIGIAILSFSHLLDYLLESFASITYAFFFGLILASAYYVFKSSSRFKTIGLVYLLLGSIIGYFIVGLNQFLSASSLLILFFSGMIAICAMILPGISGAFILLLLGQYEIVISAIKELAFVKLVVFGIGAVIGLLSFSKILDLLLKKYKSPTMSFLTGLMIGTLRLPFSRVEDWAVGIFFTLFGFALVFILERSRF